MKKCISVLIMLAMLVCMTACGAGGNDPKATDATATAAEQQGSALAKEKKALVGFCTTRLSESIFVLEQEALERVFEGRAEVQTVSCDNDTSVQISQINTFALMGADLIIINPTDVSALEDAIRSAHDAGCKIYINGATSESLEEKYYECCTVSDEFLCGAYVAMAAKNWIEGHEEMLNATGDWEIAFLESSISEDSVRRTKGIESILNEYLQDWKGNFVDAAGNPVDESGKVPNPAYCELAAKHYTGMKAEQDASNAGLNVANILTTNPNTRVFLAYNSLASTQGGQYIVDNYPDNVEEFAFFSAGVMGNEADYMVGAVSKTDGVTPSVMRGACQFGVSAAGGEVADSVANTAYAILYGQEGVDYSKKNPDGIAAWWTVDESWGGGIASVAHFNILSGATVQAFDPMAALTDANTVIYWNSRDGYGTAAEEAALPEGETFTYSENNGFMDVHWTLILSQNGTYTLVEKNMLFPDGSIYTGSYTREGDTVTCGAMGSNQPGQFDWANPDGFTVNVSGKLFAPEGREIVEKTVAPGVYSFMETIPTGEEIKWEITLNEDGSFVIAQDNPGMGNPTWTGVQWVNNGDGTVTTPDCQGEGMQLASFWHNNGITWTDNGDGTLTPVE